MSGGQAQGGGYGQPQQGYGQQRPSWPGAYGQQQMWQGQQPPPKPPGQAMSPGYDQPVPSFAQRFNQQQLGQMQGPWAGLAGQNQNAESGKWGQQQQERARLDAMPWQERIRSDPWIRQYYQLPPNSQQTGTQPPGVPQTGGVLPQAPVTGGGDPAVKGQPPMQGQPGQMYAGGTPGFYGNPTLPPQGYVTQPGRPGEVTGPWDGLLGNGQRYGGPSLGQPQPGQPGFFIDPAEATPPPGTYYGRRY
jgi:hypothetical protein